MATLYDHLYGDDIDRQFLKQEAATQVASAKRKGEIVVPTNCSVCDATTKIIGHHEDYRKPLDLKWLCKKCHSRRHIEIERLNVENMAWIRWNNKRQEAIQEQLNRNYRTKILHEKCLAPTRYSDDYEEGFQYGSYI